MEVWVLMHIQVTIQWGGSSQSERRGRQKKKTRGLLSCKTVPFQFHSRQYCFICLFFFCVTFWPATYFIPSLSWSPSSNPSILAQTTFIPSSCPLLVWIYFWHSVACPLISSSHLSLVQQPARNPNEQPTHAPVSGPFGEHAAIRAYLARTLSLNHQTHLTWMNWDFFSPISFNKKNCSDAILWGVVGMCFDSVIMRLG